MYENEFALPRIIRNPYNDRIQTTWQPRVPTKQIPDTLQTFNPDSGFTSAGLDGGGTNIDPSPFVTPSGIGRGRAAGIRGSWEGSAHYGNNFGGFGDFLGGGGSRSLPSTSNFDKPPIESDVRALTGRPLQYQQPAGTTSLGIGRSPFSTGAAGAAEAGAAEFGPEAALAQFAIDDIKNKTSALKINPYQRRNFINL